MTRLIVDDGGARRAFKLSEGRLTVGSGPGVTLRLGAEGVAEIHADLEFAGGKVRLLPRPGVVPPLVGGVPAKGAVELTHDAPVKIGGATLTVQYDDVPRAAAPGAGALAGVPARRSPDKAGRATPDVRSARRAPRSAPLRSGLPGWGLALILLGLAGLAVLLVPRILTSGPPTDMGFEAALRVAREALAEGDLERARQRIESVDSKTLDAATRQEYDALLAEYEAARDDSDLTQRNMSGNAYLQQQLKNFETNHLRGEAKRPQVRVFLKRCAEFKQRWPQHPEIEWVERMEQRFRPLAALDTPVEFDDIAFEAKALTWADPRDFRQAFELVQRFADEQARPGERPKALTLLDELAVQRRKWFDDRMQQARWEYERDNPSRSVALLVMLIVHSGDPAMAEQAATELLRFEGIDEWLRAYARDQAEKYAELGRNPVIASYIREHGIG